MTALDELCPLTELPRNGCAHCRAHPAALDRLTGDDVGARFSADYPGGCATCDGRIRVGDVIARLRDGSGYACTECLP